MNLSPAQLLALKNDILADSELSVIDHTSNAGYNAIAAIYNGVPRANGVNQAPFFVYRTNILVQDIYDAVVWANLTPTDVPDGTQTWLNRAMMCQSKQFNLQTILQGLLAVNAAKANIRAGLQDALTNVPSGVNGVALSAGWVPLRDNVLARTATRGEKLLAITTVPQDGSTAAKAATLGPGAEGLMGAGDISLAFS